MVFGNMLHHVNFLAEPALAELAHEGLLPGVGEDVSLNFARGGKALLAVTALEPGLLGPLSPGRGRDIVLTFATGHGEVSYLLSLYWFLTRLYSFKVGEKGFPLLGLKITSVKMYRVHFGNMVHKTALLIEP